MVTLITMAGHKEPSGSWQRASARPGDDFLGERGAWDSFALCSCGCVIITRALP